MATKSLYLNKVERNQEQGSKSVYGSRTIRLHAPEPEGSRDKADPDCGMRLCFASPTHQQIREGVAALADVCRKEFGVPTRIGNVEMKARS